MEKVYIYIFGLSKFKNNNKNDNNNKINKIYNFSRGWGRDLKKIKNATFVLLAGGWEKNEKQIERLAGWLV